MSSQRFKLENGPRSHSYWGVSPGLGPRQASFGTPVPSLFWTAGALFSAISWEHKPPHSQEREEGLTSEAALEAVTLTIVLP